MLTDPKQVADVKAQWNVIRRMCQGSHRQHMVGLTMVNETPPESYYNLPMVLAFSVLDEVLGYFIGQGLFTTSRRIPMLGEKMDRSRPHITWQDYDACSRAKEDRNDLAHHGTLLSKAGALAAVSLIERQLTAWNILS